MVTKHLIALYAWGVILFTLGTSIGVLAWANGDVGIAIRTGIAFVLVILVALIAARTHYVPKGKTLIRCLVIFFRTLYIIFLMSGIVFLIKALVSDYPLYLVLMGPWLIAAGGGFLILRIENELYSPH